MKRDLLILLRPGFLDGDLPGRTFYCWHCALIEGVLASFPAQAARLDVERVDIAKPRPRVIELVGEADQSLPLLVLADGGEVKTKAPLRTHNGLRFTNDKDEILDILAQRHGFAEAHP